MDSGLDDDGDGTLDPVEVDQTHYLCNLVDGALGWQDAQLLSSSIALEPAIDVIDDGRAIAVWVALSDTGSREILVAHYHPDSGWGSYGRLDDGNAPKITHTPLIAMADDGRAVAVWGEETEIYAAYYPGTGAWSNATPIASGLDPQPFPIGVAIASDGSAMIAWLQSESSGAVELWSSYYDPDKKPTAGWRAPQRIDTGSSDVRNARLVMTGPGQAIAFWTQEDDDPATNVIHARVRHFDAQNGGWQDAASIVTLRAGQGPTRAFDVALAAGPNGSAIAVWNQRPADDSQPYRLYAAHYDPNQQQWQVNAAALSNINLSKGAYTPQLGIDRDGNAVLVWGQSSDLWANHYDADAGQWDTPRRIETLPGNIDLYSLAVAANGQAMVTWVHPNELYTSATAAAYDIRANRYVPGAGWGIPQLVEHFPAGFAAMGEYPPSGPPDPLGPFWMSPPVVDMDGQGNALVVWGEDPFGPFGGDSLPELLYNRWVAP